MNIKRLGVDPYTILEIIGTYVNAQEMDTTSIDLYATYDLDLGEMGSLRLGLDATQVQEFTYTLVNGVSGDGVGEQNGPLTDIPPLPELQLQGRANWSFADNQSVLLRARWKEEVNGSYSWGFQKETNTLEALTYIDLTYNLNLNGLVGDSITRVEIGARNLLDKYPKVIGGLGGIETYVHDPRGRTLFARVKHSF
jgi:iron complex outermembrane receptor protein